MRQLREIRRLILAVVAVFVFLAGAFLFFTKVSWSVSNSRWADGGFPWKVALIDPRSPTGMILTGVAESSDTDALIVVKSDQIVFEYYSGPFGRRDRSWWSYMQGPNQLYGTASLAKSLAGSLALLITVSDGLIFVDEPAGQYVRRWNDDSIRGSITITQLASHHSGIPHGRKKGHTRADWEIAFWSRRPDLFDRVIEDVRPRFEPGTRYLYSGPAWAVLGYAITAAIANTPADNIQSLLSQRVMGPIGIPIEEWRIGYGKVFYTDDMKLYATWGGAMFTARAAARIGQFMLHRGSWNGKELVSSGSVDKLTSYTAMRVPTTNKRPMSAAGWWSNANNALPSLPLDAFIGAGSGHQLLIVVPSEQLVIVRFGRRLGRDNWDGDFWDALDRRLLMPVVTSGLLENHWPKGVN